MPYYAIFYPEPQRHRAVLSLPARDAGKGKIREGILHSDAERVRRTQILKIRAAQAFIRQGLSHERNMHGGIIAPMRKKKEPEWTVALLRCRIRPDSGVKRDPVFRGSSE